MQTQNFTYNLDAIPLKNGFFQFGGGQEISGGNSKGEIDYYPFGMLLPNRNGDAGSDYRYGFNGMEKDDEVTEQKGTSYDFGARFYNPRVGRFLSLDNYMTNFSDLSPYVFAGNTPILAIDFNGDSIRVYTVCENALKQITGEIQLALGNDYTVNYQKIDIKNATIGDTDGDGYPKQTKNTYYTITFIENPEAKVGKGHVKSTFEVLNSYAASPEKDKNIVLDAKMSSFTPDNEYALFTTGNTRTWTRYGHPRNNPDWVSKDSRKFATDRYDLPAIKINMDNAIKIANRSSLQVSDFILKMFSDEKNW